MVTTLHIKNVGIIDDLSIDLNNGFNVLTGETGAGKTLIIGSLAILAGGRFSKEMIRKGENHSYVELCMYVPNDVNSIDGNIIITREIYNNGRNMCKINGRLVTVAELKNFMSNYIEIHGQNDNQKLLDSRTHIKYLDNFSGEGIIQLKNEYKEKYQRYNEIRRELKNNYGDEKEKQRKLDLLRYQVNEIEEANLKVREEEELENENKLINNSEKIYNNLYKANELIENSAIESISTAVRNMEKIEEYSKEYENISKALKSVYYDLQEINRDLQDSNNDIYFDENKKIEIAERLDLIYTLKRKYGNSIKEIIKYKQDLEQEIYRIENLEEYTNKLKQELKQVENNLNLYASQMHEIRNKKAIELSENINLNLKELEMKNAKINILTKYIEQEYFQTGKDKVVFYISTNVGEEEKELNKIASGGEMSRIMLAIKTVLANTDKTPVLIFDEIDTGISGKAANSVAEKLGKIASKHQVICISHLPNIAASANYNYFISKKIVNERTQTNVKQLSEEEVLKEIARISSGEVNEATLKYATELRYKLKLQFTA